MEETLNAATEPSRVLVWMEDTLTVEWFPFLAAPNFGQDEDAPLVAGPEAGAEIAQEMKNRNAKIAIIFCRSRSALAAHFLANVIATQIPQLRVAIKPVYLSPSVTLSYALESSQGNASNTATLARFDTTVKQRISGILTDSPTSLVASKPSFWQQFTALFKVKYVALNPPHQLVQNLKKEVKLDPSMPLVLFTQDPEEIAKYADFTSLFANQYTTAPVLQDVKADAGVEFFFNTHVDEPTPTGNNCEICGEPLYTECCPLCHVKPRPSRRKH